MYGMPASFFALFVTAQAMMAAPYLSYMVLSGTRHIDEEMEKKAKKTKK